MSARFALQDLTVADSSGRILAGPVTLEARGGHPVTILGETGSGKSLLAQAALGLLPLGLTSKGSAHAGDVDLIALEPAARANVWGRRVAYLPQEPWLALDPLMTANRQIEETHRLVGARNTADARLATLTDINALGLSDAVDKLPGQLSGGMAQRVVFAAARAGGGRIIVADEPTKGLDEDRKRYLIALLKDDVEKGGVLLTITHDPDVARALGGDVAIMLEGRIVEMGSADDVLERPQSEYGRRLMAAEPRNWPARANSVAGDVILRGSALTMSRGGKALFSGFDIEVRKGEIISVVGPSGSGKSTLGDVLLGLISPDSGQVWKEPAFAQTRFQKLYQDPPAAFPAHATLRRTLQDIASLQQRDWSVIDSLMTSLNLSVDVLDRPPRGLSGGELQRLALLRVLLTEPAFIFADEPTSRLDLLNQKETMTLLVQTARERECGVLFVSHDRELVARVADRTIHLGAQA
jgi:peptide/nickel transport system ATP-binding protein